ncbi:DUF2895 family protein [Pseudomonas veronii]
MSTQTVSQEQLNLLWHTLGLSPDNRYRRTVTRNHFLTSPGCDDGRHLDGLVAKGLMLCGKPPAFCPQDEVVYRATRDSINDWTVNLDITADEHYGGERVKRALARYPLHIIRSDIDPEKNPFGLAWDCYSGNPQRIEVTVDTIKSGGK